jgi:hypothetical protein
MMTRPRIHIGRLDKRGRPVGAAVDPVPDIAAVSSEGDRRPAKVVAMGRIVIAAAVLLVAGVIAAVLSRRRPNPPSQGRVPVPRQLDRADFARPEAPWLVAVFTSETCDSCARATEKARLLESGEVAYDEIPWQSRKEIHERYRVEDVPLIVVADAEGVVQRSFVGAPSFADLSAAVAEAREPGSTPDPDLGLLHEE